jgi:hypothetical protein
MAKGELSNCHLCGRDTTANDGVCNRCRGRCSHTEEIGRKARSTQVLGGTCVEETDDDTLDSFNEQYHGTTTRDDI